MNHKLSDDSESANIASELGIIRLVLKFMSAHDSFFKDSQEFTVYLLWYCLGMSHIKNRGANTVFVIFS